MSINKWQAVFAFASVKCVINVFYCQRTQFVEEINRDGEREREGDGVRMKERGKNNWVSKREIAHVASRRKIARSWLVLAEAWNWVAWKQSHRSVKRWKLFLATHKWNLLISCARDHNNSRFEASCVFISTHQECFPRWAGQWTVNAEDRAWFCHRTKNQVMKFRCCSSRKRFSTLKFDFFRENLENCNTANCNVYRHSH